MSASKDSILREGEGMRTSMASMQGVVKRFGKKVVIHPLDLRIAKGEVLALLGHNGAGKSTIIKMLTGLLTADEGEIRLNGRRITPHDLEGKRLISYLPEVTMLYPHLTALEILLFFARLQEVAEERVEELLEKVGLYEARNERLRDYSKGMLQRIGFAIALLPDAPFLILDEPTSGLDPFWALRFIETIRELQQKGRTVLFASHALGEIEELADRIAILREGRIVQVGTRDELMRSVDSEVVIRVRLSYPALSGVQAGPYLLRGTKEEGVYELICPRHEKIKVLEALVPFRASLLDVEIRENPIEAIYRKWVINASQ